MSNKQFTIKAVYSFQEKQMNLFEYDLLAESEEFPEDNTLSKLETNIMKMQEDCNKFLTEKINQYLKVTTKNG
ncbi:uncharacterized protein T551_03174 [Pneumocystis jirovecii RU7]|uniref:Uncharacterized protein n=1 Tax=Pneumocystis jirovecii (strain RU7) TaxID=1408657 RepID=A0A0W4ZFM1_PNEJ7|nr:uncharacterized protein T551_03174 [Pneumocystis jirovecii RU7]KTW27180.1 hypothetical protein T551_03174 [Pneumocystis jirovecii RU7]